VLGVVRMALLPLEYLAETVGVDPLVYLAETVGADLLVTESLQALRMFAAHVR
jgi:hypothetical protein